MIDLGSKRDITRLYAAIDSNRRAMQPFRRNRHAMLREFVGSWYNERGAQYEVLVNLLNMTADVYTIGLASRNPAVRVSSEYPRLWPFAKRYQINLNSLVKEIRFKDTLQAIVLDGFFGGGVGKVYQAAWRMIQLEDDVWADPGRPYFGRISPDDFGLDLSAKDIRRCKFMWDEYRVSWDSLQESGEYDSQVVKQLTPTSKWDRGEEEANHITSGALVDDDEYGPMVDLMDVWLPEIEKVAVFPRHAETPPLKVVDQGPEGGPYNLLHFADVPDNCMPSSPAQNLMGLHLLYNGLIRKQARQAKRQKTNPVFRPEDSEDANRLRKANDGEFVKATDPTAINVISQGGVAQENIAFSIGVFDMFNTASGNLRAMAGLGPTAETVGQEQMVLQAASRKEAKMLERVKDFSARVVEGLGHLMWADQVLEIPAYPEVEPGIGVHMDLSWTPELREGDPWQYNFDVEPFSTAYEPPELKVSKMDRAISQLTRLYPMIQALGGAVDVELILREYVETLGLREFERAISFAQPGMAEMAQSGRGGVMNPETTRNYVRRNVPTGGTPDSRSNILQQAMYGGGQINQDQAASIFRQ